MFFLYISTQFNIALEKKSNTSAPPKHNKQNKLTLKKQTNTLRCSLKVDSLDLS